MNRIVNPLLMLVPESMMGALLVLLLVVGGLLVTMGQRKSGSALVATAISFPVVMLVLNVLFDSVFAAVPVWLMQPLAVLLTVAFYLTFVSMMVKMLVGSRAYDEAKGRLLADAIKALLRVAFRWPVMLTWLGILTYLAWPRF